MIEGGTGQNGKGACSMGGGVGRSKNMGGSPSGGRGQWVGCMGVDPASSDQADPSRHTQAAPRAAPAAALT